jgi:2-phospho-L-lactate guanylyltransferase
MALWAIVPVKSINQGKSRLSGILNESERATLNKAMLTNLLQVLRSSDAFSGVVIVSHDTEAKNLVEGFTFEYFEEQPPYSLNTAIESVCRYCSDRGATEILILPADLPLLNQKSLESLIKNNINPPVVVIAPDRREGGTNSLLINPLNGFSFQFGEDSFSKHQIIAHERQYRVVVVHDPGTELDLDLPEDWDTYQNLINQKIQSNGG